MRLAEAGFFPIVLDKNESTGKELLADLSRQAKAGEFFALDLTKKPDVQGTFAKVMSAHGRIDVLVNLAGGTLHARLIQDFPLREWQEVGMST